MAIPRSFLGYAVFIDTSAFYAFLDRSDRWHKEAVEGFKKLASERRPIYTTNLVIAETYALILVRLGLSVAQSWLEALRVNLFFQRREDHERVKALLLKYRDKDFSYTDGFSFLAMEELGIKTAFAFDPHFLQYGWQVYSGFL